MEEWIISKIKKINEVDAIVNDYFNNIGSIDSLKPIVCDSVS